MLPPIGERFLRFWRKLKGPHGLRGQLVDAQARWERTGTTDYRYEMQWHCFCAEDFTAPVRVSVVDGAVAEIGFSDPERQGEVFSPERFGPMERLFEFIQDAIDRHAAGIQVEFHEMGYPTSGYVHYSLIATDTEVSFSVENLESR